MGKTHTDRGLRTYPREHGAAFGVTSHAIEQFQSRVAPGLSRGKARLECLVLARSARLTDERTGTGDEVWVATDGKPVRFVVRREGRRRVCVTILAPLAGDAEPEVA